MIKNLVTLLLILASCSQNPVTGKNELSFISEQEEISIGTQYYGYLQQAEGGDYVVDPALQEYVQKVGDKLAAVSDRPSLPYEFVVLNNSIPNAWSLPGGKIAINRGLLLELEDEAELAAVLSHEIVHSAARHGAQAMERATLMSAGIFGLGQLLQDHKYEDLIVGSASVGAGLTALKYSRSAELEADEYGIKYMVAAGYDPEAAVDLQKTFLRLSQNRDAFWFEGLFATHPPSQERLEANEKTAAQYPKGGFRGKEEYQAAIAHLKETKPAYDDLDKGYEALSCGNPIQAIVFAHQGIEIEPKEGHLYNLKGKGQVQLKDSQKALRLFDQAIECNPNYFDFYLQRGLLKQSLGQFSSAYRDLERSNELLPSAEAHLALGEIALKEGRREDALYHFQVAGQADNVYGRKALQELNSLKSSSNNSSVQAEVIFRSPYDVELVVTNSSVKTVSNIRIEVTYFDKKMHVLKKEMHTLPGKLPWGAQGRKNLIAPNKTASASARVVSCS